MQLLEDCFCLGQLLMSDGEVGQYLFFKALLRCFHYWSFFYETLYPKKNYFSLRDSIHPLMSRFNPRCSDSSLGVPVHSLLSRFTRSYCFHRRICGRRRGIHWTSASRRASTIPAIPSSIRSAASPETRNPITSLRLYLIKCALVCTSVSFYRNALFGLG